MGHHSPSGSGYTTVPRARSDLSSCQPLTLTLTLQVHEVLDKIKDYSEAIRTGAIRGATGKIIRSIIAVGIGGSYLGPACIHEVFKVERDP